MGLFRFIIIVFLVYMIFRILSRYIFPWLIRFSLKRFQSRFYKQNPNLRPEKQKKEGEITIKKVKKEEDGKIPDDFGDYVDYEDVK
ncbi:MAG: hypothetical protein K0B15_11465 [Lentimicrobium sp.]|nr:hypothetical protein [Lentimicrobium sp.]